MAEIPSGTSTETTDQKEYTNSPKETTGQDVDDFARRFLLADASGAKELHESQQSRLDASRDRYEQGCQNTMEYSRSCRAEVQTDIPGEATKILERVKKELYAALKIDESGEKTGFTEFKKGFVDGIIGENIDLAKELIVKGVDGLVESISKALESAEKAAEFVMKVIEHVGEDFKKKLEKIQNFDPYGYGNTIGSLGIGPLAGIIKGFGKGVIKAEIKAAEKEVMAGAEAKAVKGGAEGVDFMQIRANFRIEKNMPLKDVSQKMSEYAKALDVKEVLVDPRRVSEALDIIRPMLEHTNANVENIRKMSKMEFGGYSQGILDLQRGLAKIEEALPKSPEKNLITEFRLREFQETKNTLVKARK